MIKTEIAGTLEKYEIKDTPGGKVAKFIVATKVELEPGLAPLGIDFQEFNLEGTTKEKVFQNIPLLTEVLKLQLWDSEDKETGALAAHTLENINVDKAKVVQVKLNSDSEETEPVAKITFSAWASRDFNDWLYVNLVRGIALKLTQKIKQETLDFNNDGEMSADAQEMTGELDNKMSNNPERFEVNYNGDDPIPHDVTITCGGETVKTNTKAIKKLAKMPKGMLKKVVKKAKEEIAKESRAA